MLPIGCALGDSRGAVGQVHSESGYMRELPADLLEVLATLWRYQHYEPIARFSNRCPADMSSETNRVPF